jgi:hypothetical protein
MKEDVKRMLAALGLNPERRACEQLADLLERLLPLWGAPSLADAYRQTGARFGVRAVQVERNVRALILGLSDSPGGRAALRGLLPWHAGEEAPGNRAFLLALAARLRIERAAGGGRSAPDSPVS